MDYNVDTYALLIDAVGEKAAYKLCEKLGGLDLRIPNKKHKVFRTTYILNHAYIHIKDDRRNRTRIIKDLIKYQELAKSRVYEIFKQIKQEKENDGR